MLGFIRRQRRVLGERLARRGLAHTFSLPGFLLHERLAVGWRGRRAAWMSIIGFAVMLFTFLGVNFLLKGHHGQFTNW